MSRKHPQNGPSLSKAPHKKQKPLTEKEIAEHRARQKAAEETQTTRVEEAQRKVAGGRRFGAAVKANGGVIPMRGGNAGEFWSRLRAQDEPRLVPARKPQQKKP
jgi:hypothetical protein